jgi:hypothetical protein
MAFEKAARFVVVNAAAVDYTTHAIAFGHAAVLNPEP